MLQFKFSLAIHRYHPFPRVLFQIFTNSDTNDMTGLRKQAELAVMVTWNLIQGFGWETFMYLLFLIEFGPESRRLSCCCWQLPWVIRGPTFQSHFRLVPLALIQPHWDVLFLPSFHYSQSDFILPWMLPIINLFSYCEMMDSKKFRIGGGGARYTHFRLTQYTLLFS